MANTYSKIYIHAVFAVKYRQALISKQFSPELYRYMAGIIKSEKQIPLMINGVADHVHLGFAVKPTVYLPDLLRDIKANSSRWINERGFLKHKFAWQRGYGAFSFGYLAASRVIRYIENQEAHHRSQSFKEEYIGILEREQIPYEEKYLFNWELE